MATRETRRQRGRRRGEYLVARLVSELVDARLAVGVSQRVLARELGCSQSQQSRLEHLRGVDEISVVRIAELASLLGLELSASLHPVGEPLRDKGHQALIRRFRALLSPSFDVTAEVPLPIPGGQRSWDLVLRLHGQLVGVEVETRIRDIQALVRHLRQRERDGGVDEVLLVLATNRTNAELVDELRAALGGRFATSPRALLRALRAGLPLPASGVVLI